MPARGRPSACRANSHILVSIDYRLAPETQLPEVIADVEDAFRWIRKEGPKLFGADPEPDRNQGIDFDESSPSLPLSP